MSLLLLLPSGVAPPPPEAPVNIPIVTFAGVVVPVMKGTLDILEVANGRNTLTCDVVLVDTAARPTIDAPVIVTVNDIRIYGGMIDSTSEKGVGKSHVRVRVNCNDFNALADRRYVKATLAAGTLKSMLITLMPYLSNFGVTLDPAQVDGPVLVDDLLYDYRQVTEVLNELSTLTGYVWDIDYYKQLSMYAPGALAAPFDITSTNGRALGDVQIDQHARSSYANRIILRAGGSGTRLITDTWIADGTSYLFLLDFPFANASVGYVQNGAVNETFTIQGAGSTAQWLYYSDNSIRRETGGAPAPPVAGTTLAFTYLSQMPFTVGADSLPDQTTHGVMEKLVEYPELFDKTMAQLLAFEELAIALERLDNVSYPTRGQGLKPGQTQNITVSERNIIASYLITEIQSRDDADGILRRQVSAVHGTKIKETWREYWKGLSGSGGARS